MNDPSSLPYQNLAQVVDHWAEDPDKVALIWMDAEAKPQRRLTFREIRDGSLQLAAYLQSQGHKPGERIGIIVGRDPEWWVSMIGLCRAGLVAIPGTTLLTPKDIQFRIERGEVRGMIADAPCAEKVDAIRAQCPDVNSFVITEGARNGWEGLPQILSSSRAFEPVTIQPDDPCLIYFTSGTTGPPKMVVQLHESYLRGHAVTARAWLDLKPSDIHWNLSDTGWAKAAWSSLYAPWIQGAAVFVYQNSKFDAQTTLDILRDQPITTFCAPPTVYRQLVRLDLKARPFHSLRHPVAAGEPLNPEVISIWKEATGQVIRDAYGQTESALLIGNQVGQKVKPGSMGLPAPGIDIELIDDNLNPVPPNTEGDVAVRIKPKRPWGLFPGYLDNPEENANRFRGDYYLTGDRATRDEDGYFWFVSRDDDVILSAGYRIGPFEVESALVEHPSVLEAAVVGSPDPDRYLVVKAFVVLVQGHEPSDALANELKAHVKQSTAPYKYPREIEFVDSLPKTISGKIRRVELRERERIRKANRQ